GMRFTPVSVCAKTYQRPSSSAKLRKYVCPFASNCTFNLPWVRQNLKKQATGFHGCCLSEIRTDPCQSVAKPFALVISYPLHPRTPHRLRLRPSWHGHSRTRPLPRWALLLVLPLAEAEQLYTFVRPACATPGSASRGPCPWLTCRRFRAPFWRRRLRSRRRHALSRRSCRLAHAASSLRRRPWNRVGSWRRSLRAGPCPRLSARRLPWPYARLLLCSGRTTT